MSFLQRLASAATDQQTVLTIGVFDGVHQGHRHLLRRLVELAGNSYVPGVLTFSNHPITVLRPETQVNYLSTPEEKVSLIKQQGVELVVCLDFDHELSQVTAKDFASGLVESLGMKGLLMGPDSALGKDRQGDADYMKEQGSQMGFWVESIDPLTLDGTAVKSRRIRECVAGGDVQACGELLGRLFSLTGQVVTGDQRGRELGFPTANLDIAPQMLLPGDGIYATWVYIDGERHPSATSIGIRPTFGLEQRLVEVFVIDFKGDLYGKDLQVEFVSKLRGQEKFSDVETLVAQIHQDVADARGALDRDIGQ